MPIHLTAAMHSVADNGLLFSHGGPHDVRIKEHMMVAEFMGRNQSGSPVNGELPHITSNMPGSHCRDGMLSNTNSPSPDSYQGSYSAMSPHPHNGGEGKTSSNGSSGSTKGELLPQRKQREFTPENKKDDSYWDRRRRNNEAAKRSREKRRFNDMILEQRVLELTKENTILKAQLETIKEEFGICGENVVNVEKVLATLPTNEQMLSGTKRQKISHGNQYFGGGTAHSPIPTPVIQSVMGLPGSPSPPPPSMPSASAHSVSSSLQHQQQQHSPPAVLHDPAYRDMVEYPQHLYPGHGHGHSHSNSTYHSIHHPHHPQHLPHLHTYGLHHPTPSSLSHHNDEDDGDNALNLTSRASRISRARESTQSPTTYEISSNSGDESSTVAPLALTTNSTSHVQHSSNNNNNNNISSNSEANNSLPLKLRHKQHPLGDKDAANTLLSLQHIKQEPGNSSRCSPPYDGEGSSDERDSGISLGSECPPLHPQPSIIPDVPKAMRMRNEMRLDHQITPASAVYLRSMGVVYHRTKQHAKETPA